jgi:hypothetical protein
MQRRIDLRHQDGPKGKLPDLRFPRQPAQVATSRSDRGAALQDARDDDRRCASPGTVCASSQVLGLISSIDRTTAAVARKSRQSREILAKRDRNRARCWGSATGSRKHRHAKARRPLVGSGSVAATARVEPSPKGFAQAGKAARTAESFELRADLLRAAVVIRTGDARVPMAKSIEERFNPAIGRGRTISGAMDPSIK